MYNSEHTVGVGADSSRPYNRLLLLSRRLAKLLGTSRYSSINIIHPQIGRVIYKHNKKAPTTHRNQGYLEKRQLPTLPHCIAVPSAQSGLTSLFGMGRGGTPTQ